MIGPLRLTRRGVRPSVALAISVAALAAMTAALGCAASATDGYVWGEAFRTDFETIAVPIFENQSYERDLGLQLTEAVIKEIERVAPYETTGRSEAAAVLNGVVTNAELRRLARDRDSGLVLDLAYTITVSFEVVDSSTGEVLVSRRGLRVGESFIPARGANEPIEAGRAAAVREAAREIVESLRSSW